MGDQVLETVGRLLGQVRASDVVARYGGDEFVVLMPGTTYAEGEQVIERIRERLSALNHEGRFSFPIRLSIGLREMEQSEDILAAADEAMYSEKRRRARALGPIAEEPDAEDREAETTARGRE
jgi:diguanylate cyclase (GGDEF)-like protein